MFFFRRNETAAAGLTATIGSNGNISIGISIISPNFVAIK
jgi:hypothetical protein